MMLTSSVRPNRSGWPRRSINDGRPAAADRDAGGAAAPGAAEAVADDDGRRSARTSASARPDRFGRAVRIDRQQQRALARRRARDIGLIDAGIRHHEAQPVLHDHQVRPAAHDLAPIPTARPGRSADPCRPPPPARSRRADGDDVGEIDRAALGLRDDLLRDHHDVADPATPSRLGTGRRAISAGRSSPACTIGRPGIAKSSRRAVMPGLRRRVGWRTGNAVMASKHPTRSAGAASAAPARRTASGSAPGPCPARGTPDGGSPCRYTA